VVYVRSLSDIANIVLIIPDVQMDLVGFWNNSETKFLKWYILYDIQSKCFSTDCWNIASCSLSGDI